MFTLKSKDLRGGFLILGAALALSGSARADRDSFQQRTIERARVARNMEYNQLKDLLIQTQAMVDALLIQIEMAPKGAREALFEVAKEEFRLSRSVRVSISDALDYSRRYLALERELMGLETRAKSEKPSLESKRKIAALEEEAKKLRVKGQKVMKKFHKELKSDELQIVRNWLTISEGSLIRDREQEALAAAKAAPASAAEAQAASVSVSAGAEP